MESDYGLIAVKSYRIQSNVQSEKGGRVDIECAVNIYGKPLMTFDLDLEFLLIKS